MSSCSLPSFIYMIVTLNSNDEIKCYFVFVSHKPRFKRVLSKNIRRYSRLRIDKDYYL